MKSGIFNFDILEVTFNFIFLFSTHHSITIKVEINTQEKLKTENHFLCVEEKQSLLHYIEKRLCTGLSKFTINIK